MRALLAALALGLGPLGAAPALAQRAGVYDVAGTNPDGSPYAGVVGMRQVGLASWQVRWEVGDNRFEGYAMSSGNTFAVGFSLRDRPGIAIYSVGADGSLAGQWTIVGTGAIGTEVLTPRPAPAAAPSAPAPTPAPATPAPAAPPAPPR